MQTLKISACRIQVEDRNANVYGWIRFYYQKDFTVHLVYLVNPPLLLITSLSDFKKDDTK